MRLNVNSLLASKPGRSRMPCISRLISDICCLACAWKLGGLVLVAISFSAAPRNCIRGKHFCWALRRNDCFNRYSEPLVIWWATGSSLSRRCSCRSYLSVDDLMARAMCVCRLSCNAARPSIRCAMSADDESAGRLLSAENLCSVSGHWRHSGSQNASSQTAVAHALAVWSDFAGWACGDRGD